VQLELLLQERGDNLKSEVREKWLAALKRIAEDEQRYAQEKKEIEKEAKQLEQERDLNRSKDPYFDYAEVLLQIAIVMSSIAILASSRRVFIFACVAATLGALLTLNGFFLLVKIPFLH
jgi:hypothetical protein